jgi:hypothetical protein
MARFAALYFAQQAPLALDLTIFVRGPIAGIKIGRKGIRAEIGAHTFYWEIFADNCSYGLGSISSIVRIISSANTGATSRMS